MSFLRHKRKKSKYEILTPEGEEESGILIKKGYSRDTVNLFINNFIDPDEQSTSGLKKTNFKDKLKCKSWDVCGSRKEQLENSKFKKTLSDMNARKFATFSRLKKKLENMKNFYPDVYYNEKNVIDMWATPGDLNKVNLDLLEYDQNLTEWLWI